MATAASLDGEELSQATKAATEAGMEIARKFATLDRRQRLTVISAFRRQLLPPGKPGRRRSKAITRKTDSE
jgi:hypothetical protein